MPYTLDIHTIDVGQGESSLIIADNRAGRRRVMLIDGGLAAQAQTVHNRIRALAPAGPDHIVVTHYDDDHSGGITALLIADNLYKLCDMIAGAVATTAATGSNRAERVALGALAACATMLGAYDDPQGEKHSDELATARLDLMQNPPALGAISATAAEQGVAVAESTLKNSVMNPSFFKTMTRRNLSKEAGLAADGGRVAIRTAIFNKLQGRVQKGSGFQTGGIYANTHMIDTGATNIPDGYEDAIAGSFTLSGDTKIKVPGISRERTSTPDLGDEILWNSGPDNIKMNAPAGSPAVFVVARNQYIWKAAESKVPIPGGLDGNGFSIGMIVRFNKFFFYTGGDLPAAGENLVATAVMGTGLPNPAGGQFAVPHRVAAFKCGHHGANTSTSQTFLNTINPKAAFISCARRYEHPDQPVIDRLHASDDIRYFYVTNCKVQTNHVPGSDGKAQLVVGNKSRIAGDNADNNLAAGRDRGDIQLSISQDESTSIRTVAGGGVLREFHVTYYDSDDLSDEGEVGNRTEDVPF